MFWLFALRLRAMFHCIAEACALIFQLPRKCGSFLGPQHAM
jgi:hypothetical protein